MSENENKTRELKKKASLYVIIAFCLLVAGCASFLTAKRNITLPNRNEKSTAAETPSAKTEPLSDSRVNEAVSGIKDDRTETPNAEESTSEAVTEPVTLVMRAESFTLPIDTPVLKNYSDSKIVYSKTTDDWRSHNGIDFSGNMGDPVIAVNNGIVKNVYSDTLWGTVVEIDHGEGLIAKYCGLGKGSTVKEGDEVKINQRIGNLSEIPIENGDGIHLHFETTLDGMTVNPIIALGLSENDIR